MAKRLPPRDSKGRFTKRGRSRSRRRSNPSKAKLRRKANRQPRDRYGRFKRRGSSRRYRRNPGGFGEDIMSRVVDGSIAAVQLTVGKAASRAVPQLLNLPSGGPVGVAIRAGTGVGLGLVVDNFMGGDLGERILEGALQGALEDVIVGYNLPFIGPALARAPGIVPAGGTTGRYLHSGPADALRAYGNGNRMARYTGSDMRTFAGVRSRN